MNLPSADFVGISERGVISLYTTAIEILHAAKWVKDKGFF